MRPQAGPTMLDLTNKLLVIACVVSTVGAKLAGHPVARRQDQYASFSNSSGLLSTASSFSSIAFTSSGGDTQSSYKPEIDPSTSSQEGARFSYSPETTSSVLASPAPSITSIVCTSSSSSSSSPSSRPTSGLSFSFSPSGAISGTPPYPYPSAGTPSASIVSSYFPITASRVQPPLRPRCRGETVNVRNASFDWWNPETIDHAVSTLSFQHDSDGQQTGWTILPADEPLTLSDSFQRYTCDQSNPTIETDFNTGDTWTYHFDCSFVPITIAAATTATTVTAFPPYSTTTGTEFDVPDIRATRPPDPSITFTAINATFRPNANFVYFTEYEIESSDTTTYANGSGTCITTTASYNLSDPYALSYTGPDPQSATDPVAAITGNIGQDFLDYIGQADATAGAFTAVPTVIVVVEEVFMASLQVFAERSGTMQTATALDTPTAVLPSGFSASATADDDNWASNLYTALTASARIESTAQVLLVPPPSTRSTVPPALNQQAGSSTSISTGLGKNGVGTVGAGDTSPGNANDVFSQALGPAIMQGIGGTPDKSSTNPNVNIAGSTASPTSVTAIVVSGQTAIAGGPPITVRGTVVSVATSGTALIIDGTTTQVPAGTATTFAIDGAEFTATRASAFDIASQTLVAGGSPITVDGTRLSFASGGNAIVIGSSTRMLSPPAVITIASKTVTADAATRFVLGPGQTLTPGGTAVVSGTTISLVPSGTAIVVAGRTTPVRVATAGTALITAAPVLVIDGQQYSPTAGGYVISGQTLLAGGVITFTGRNGIETVSLDRAGSVVVDVISGKSTTTTLTVAAPAITLGGQTFTALPGPGATYVVAGQTLTAGSVKTVVISETTYVVSLAATPTAVMIQTLGSNGRAIATSTEMLYAGITSATSAANKSPAAPSDAAATSAPATGQASSIMTELLAALCGAAALAAAVFL